MGLTVALVVVALSAFHAASAAGALQFAGAPAGVPPTFTQSLNHSDPKDARTWEQRWYVGDTSSYKGGPIVFYVGAESPTDAWCVEPSVFEPVAWAARQGGVAIGAEHRFFGQSLPFGNASFTPASLAYLTVEQALADYAAIIRQVLRGKVPGLPIDPAHPPPVVVFGGSYGGFLSAAMRVHYPDLVTASIASAAPVYQAGDVDNSTWYDLVSDTITNASAGGACARNVNAEFEIMLSAYNNASKRALMAGMMGLCEEVVTPLDAILVLFWAKHAYSTTVEFDYSRAQSPTHVKRPVEAMCATAGPPRAGQWFPATRMVVQWIYNDAAHPAKCVHWKQGQGATRRLAPRPAASLAASAAGPSATELADAAAHATLLARASMSRVAHRHAPRRAPRASPDTPSGLRAVGDPLPIQHAPWNWLCCTEIVLPMAGQGIFALKQPFDLAALQRSCAKTYGPTAVVDADWHRAFVTRHLPAPGGSGSRAASAAAGEGEVASNIVFTNGGADPVRGFAPASNLSASVVAVNIARMGHTFDLFATQGDDPPEVLAGRAATYAAIESWLAPAQ